jgi:hypothetical protein
MLNTKTITTTTDTQMKVHLLILLITLPALLSAQPTALTPQIPEYFGATYDIFSGNPLSKDIDPGFLPKQLFKYTYAEDRKTSDGKYFYPKEVTALAMNSCSRSFKSTEINGLKSYHDALEQSVSISGGYDGLIASVSFTASVDYQSAESSLTTQQKVHVITQEKCQLYEVGLNSDPILSEDFLKAVDNALLQGSWEQFIKEWGTHYATRLVMGASAIKETTFSRETVQQLQSAGVNVAAGVSGSYAKAKGSLDTKTGLSTSQQSYFDKADKEERQYYIGAQPDPNNNNNATWILNIEKSQPLPLSSTLNYIGDLFNSTGYRYFGTKFTPTQLNQMRKDFTDTFKRMAAQMGTRVPSKDPELNSIKILLSATVVSGGMGGHNFEDLPMPNFFMKPVSIQIRSGDKFNGISMTLSDGVTTQETDWHGSKDGELKTYTIPPGRRIVTAHIWTAETVVGLRFVNDDGTHSPVYGKQSGDFHEVVIYGYLIGFRGREGKRLDSLGFLSNEYSYDPANPKSVPYATLLYGGDGGSFFMDDFALESTDPIISLNSGRYIDMVQLQILEDEKSTSHAMGGYHGGNGGRGYATWLHDLQQINIWSDHFVDALQFKINGRMSAKYGGSGGDLQCS